MEEIRRWQEPEQEMEPENPAEQPGEQADAGLEEKLAGMVEALGADLRSALESQLREALRREAMSPEERAAWEAQDRERALDAREQALLRRELRADAQELLAAKGLPAALADAMRLDDRAALAESAAALETAFRQAVQQAVEERLKGHSPAAGASAQDPGAELDDESYYRLQLGRQ